MSATIEPRVRIGGHVVVESLAALGADSVFGVPGIHALATWEALRTDGRLQAYGTRTELCAGFAADGYARSSGRPGVLLLSTGPGALNSLTALMEAASSHVPVIAISSQIPRALMGRGRGFLHELPDQLGSFAPLVKRAARAETAEAIPELLAELWAHALTPPSGPVFLEIPVDVLAGETSVSPVSELTAAPRRHPARGESVAAAAQALGEADNPVIWAGGGVVRSGAFAELVELAERLGCPVATTYMGKNAIPDDHPLAAGCGCDEGAFAELIENADVVLCVGTELGAETTRQYELQFGGEVIQIDAAPERIGTSYPALAVVGDAKLTLQALNQRLGEMGADGAGRVQESRAKVTALRARIREGLEAQGHDTELALLQTLESAMPEDAITVWDMTILGYWAAPHLRMRGAQQFLYPLGSGTLGYSWPATIGAAVAHRGQPVLGVVGDGGFQYALAELGTARQHALNAKLLVVDDGGYGILRSYQSDAYGQTTAVDLAQPGFAALAEAFGVPVREGAPEDLPQMLHWQFSVEGPAVTVVRGPIDVAGSTS
jgi:acetolactate synthase I/II/III large subunit